VRAPTVHLNGTGKADLLEAARTAYSALGEARRALQGVCPNGRDYYPQDAGQAGSALRVATAEWQKMEGRLQAVQEELATLLEDIDRQGD
jgi:hypothetical protein